MPLKRCENGHNYDPAKHTTCPYCAVPLDLPQAGAPRANPGAHGGAQPKTRSILSSGQASGVDPVVGWLVCVDGPDRGRDYRLHSERNFIGRASGMDVAVLGDDTVSRENHAVVSFNPRGNEFKVAPGTGRGLVYLNDTEVEAPKKLSAGDLVTVGRTRLRFVPLCGKDFSWSDAG